jgi:hypothetical protein
MANSILTIVFEKAEQKIETVVAAAVNELHNLGHTVKEVRVMGDSGEAKIALNQVEGIIDTAKDTAEADVKTDVAALTEPSDTVENKSPDGTSPVSPISIPTPTADVSTATDAGVPVDDGTPSLTIAERREAALKELEALDAEEDASSPISGVGSVDPTSTAGTTPVTA